MHIVACVRVSSQNIWVQLKKKNKEKQIKEKKIGEREKEKKTSDGPQFL